MRNQFLIGLSFAAVVAYSCIGDFGVANVIAISNAAEIDYAPQVSNERQVKITAALQNIQKEAKTWDFEVSTGISYTCLERDPGKLFRAHCRWKTIQSSGLGRSAAGRPSSQGFVALQGDCATTGFGGIADTPDRRSLAKKLQVAAEMSNRVCAS